MGHKLQDTETVAVPGDGLGDVEPILKLPLGSHHLVDRTLASASSGEVTALEQGRTA